MSGEAPEQSEWQNACLAAALFAANPAHLHGLWVKARPGPVRDLWTDYVKSLFPPEAPFGKLPLNATDETLFGGLDLTATLGSAKLVWRPGLLSRLNGGVIQISLADRLPQGIAAQLGSVLDRCEVVLEQDGLSNRSDVMVQIIALDEGAENEAPQAVALYDRLAFRIMLAQTGIRDAVAAPYTEEETAEARRILPQVEIPDTVLAALCRVSLELGIASLRGPLLAVAAAKAHAALDGRLTVTAEDAAVAARFVLAPRALIVPASEDAPNQEQPDSDGDSKSKDGQGESDNDNGSGEMEEMILAAAKAALPPNLLSALPKTIKKGSAKGQGGRSGIERTGGTRGRPHGVRRARGQDGERISAVDTIRVAAPWQNLRRQHAHSTAHFHVRKDDLRVRRYKSFVQTTTIFAVDASGSAALQRLSEAKGAVELLLADCYVRRDQVALIAFRGHEAQILLPPTRSLVRAKRALAALAGGGGTPLAAGIRAAAALAEKTRRNGGFPVIVLLTDGKANIAANREANRETAHADAMKIARFLRAGAVPSLLVDTSPRPQPKASQLAREMGALYLPLPYADARAISAAALSMGTPS